MIDTLRRALTTYSMLITGTACSLFGITSVRASDPAASIISDAVVFEEIDGTLAVEAEHFYQQTLADVRAWHITSAKTTPLVEPRTADGNGSVTISGVLKQWHKVTLTLDGPFAHERDKQPNPFTDYRMTVTFRHESGSPTYDVPGYFAADGDAANSSAESGTKWRAHLSPDKPGKWSYSISFQQGSRILDRDLNDAAGVNLDDEKEGSFIIAATDKSGRDFRGKGRLQYVGGHYLRFAGSGERFLKAGPDAPETLLAYTDFDGTIAPKKNAPLKTWHPHVRDWGAGDPTWKDEKGKGLIGALNYLASKGCNTFSFLPYNAGGDGNNVWPFVAREDNLHDVRKLCLWGTLTAGGAGVEYYFGYKLPQNDLLCEDFRSRDRSWDYCRIALDFFRDHQIPFWEMTNADELIGNATNSNDRFCLAKSGELYLVYLPNGGTTELKLSGAKDSFRVQWFNPRSGGKLIDGSVTALAAGDNLSLGRPPEDAQDDWLAVVRHIE